MQSQQEDKAAKAYASISSQLKEWNRHDQDQVQYETRIFNSNSQQRRRRQQQQTGPLYFQDDDDDEEEEDHTLKYVSKRESGAFSPLADFHPHGDNPTIQTPSSLSSRASTLRTGRNRNPASRMEDNSDYYNSAPVETPFTKGSTTTASVSASTSTTTKNRDPTTAASRTVLPSVAHRASLDGDYRPYHDALHFLLVPSSKALKSKMISLQYLGRISALAYSRATRLREDLNQLQMQMQMQNEEEEIYGSNGTRSMMEMTIRSLEREGHLGSLICRLAEQSNVVMGKDKTTTAVTNNDFLFYNPPSISVIERDVMTCICDFVQKNENLDLAAVDLYLSESLKCSSWLNVSKGEEMTLPMVIRRRQVILKWLESCHEKTLSGQDWIVSGGGGGGGSNYGSGSKNIMWKDTLEKFMGDQHSFMASSVGVNMKSNDDKVQEYHPDAPLMVVSKQRRVGTVNDAPLYGNDNKREIDLLEKCLLLMKAGKMNRMYELCHEVGQPWRAAAWDGDTPHGYVVVDNAMDDDEGKRMDMDVDGNKYVPVGNPQRCLWKRNLWEMSQALHSLIYQQNHKQQRLQQERDGNRDNDGKSVLCSGSVVYEAAISAILANNSMIAFQNPLLNKDWMDSLWVLYHGLQARFREIVYHEHNNRMRDMDNPIKIKNMSPLHGTEYQQEEKEQLQCTSELSRVEEGVFISRLAGRSGMKSFGDWDKGITAFILGMNEAQKYIANSIRFLVDAANNQKKNQESYDSFLRFMLHLVLFFESLCGEDDTVASRFYSNTIAPQRNELIMAYLQQLMKHKPLWEFYNLYASLLPDQLLVDACTDFWSTFVFDGKDRRMVLKSAREYFGQGTDLVILRNVVRASCAPMEEDSDPLLLAAWLGQPSDYERYDEELESMISHDDIRKMHSIRWMCIYHEHYADAIVFANMLLRGFLLEFCLSNEAPQNDEFDDWTNSPKVYAAKVFQARFLPENIVQVACQSVTDEDYLLSQDEVDENISEYRALLQFLDAHTAYENWKEYISDAPATVAFTQDSRFENNTVESDVALKVQIMNYVKEKKEIAQGLIKVATAAKDSLMKVLEFENGWLNIFEDIDMIGNEIVDSNNEQNERCRQIQILRSKCLSTAVSLMFRVCHTTALWMEDFTRDVETVFEDDYSDIISRITGYGFFESKGMPNPFQPASWHRMALLMANTVASSDTKIADYMSKEELGNFMKCMAETNICLLKIQEQNDSRN